MSNFQLTIAQRDPPHHAIVAELHDRVPTPTQGGGGWEEIQMPRRAAVLIWRGRGLLKLSLSVVFDDLFAGNSVITDNYRTLLRFWRPEANANRPPPEPSVLKLSAASDVVPYQELAYVITNLEWGAAEADEQGQRVQQILVIEFTEFRADERLKPTQKPKGRTERYKVRPGDTLAKIAKRHGITAKELGAMQKPPIHDNRQLQQRKVIVVPVTRKPTHRHN